MPFTRLCILFLFFSGATGWAQTSIIHKLNGEPLPTGQLNQHILHLMDSLEMAGISIGIINRSELVYHEVFGVINRQTQTPVNKQSIFEGASLSKPIFA